MEWDAGVNWCSLLAVSELGLLESAVLPYFSARFL